MSEQHQTTTSISTQASSTAGGDSTARTPASTPPASSHKRHPFTQAREMGEDGTISEKTPEPGQEDGTENTAEAVAANAATEPKTPEGGLALPKSKKSSKCRKPEHKKTKTDKASTKTGKKKEPVNDSSSSESDKSSDSESSEDESCRKKKAKKTKKIKKTKSKDGKKVKSKDILTESDSSVADDSSSSSSDDGSSSSEEDNVKPKRSSRKAKSKKNRKLKKPLPPAIDDESEDASDASEVSNSAPTKESLELKLAAIQQAMALLPKDPMPSNPFPSLRTPKKKQRAEEKKKGAKKSKGDAEHYKRVDEIWDKHLHMHKLKESTDKDDSEFAEYAWLVRRTFNWENKYISTVIDIKSKLLRDVLQVVLKGCKSVSLEAEEPVVDPNLLFLYLEEFRTFYKKTLKSRIKEEKKKKVIKKLEQQRSIVKAMVAYLDVDYEDTKKTLYPLLAAGNITFDLLWALFKPNEVAVTSCYGVWDEPRCFQVEYATKESSMTRGEWYCIEGRYLEYDGKSFGYGDFEVDVEGFKGPRKITSLSTYPLKYHKDGDAVKKQILERAERFVSMEGMQYRLHKGLAFMKKKKQVLKVNINGRIMVDPAIFRRINPNYPISWIKPKDSDKLFDCFDDEEYSDEEGGGGCCSCGEESDAEVRDDTHEALTKNDWDEASSPKYKYKWEKNDKGQHILVAVEVDEDGEPLRPQRVDQMERHPDLRAKSFTEKELLLTSPVVLGFSFSEKLWLEFTVSGIHDIVWNEAAFESLVLPTNQKSIVRALVESHKFHAAKTIDDVVQGKGKGLVAVLHGPPGTGKTLTAEGISEMLKCPLYMVSAGELGTQPERLEHELQKILDIAHSWGAILLLDEADVFLEKRQIHDIHRNALVSVFLRALEYYQGLLFLTTNRVETFDEAFQSRIHVALRYGELTHKARKAVWEMFIDKVRKVEGMQVAAFSDYEMEVLARNPLNGRQIKNLVRTAQALALNEKAMLTIEHIKRVIDVAETFDRDLKGGTGYIDAMRSYT